MPGRNPACRPTRAPSCRPDRRRLSEARLSSQHACIIHASACMARRPHSLWATASCSGATAAVRQSRSLHSLSRRWTSAQGGARTGPSCSRPASPVATARRARSRAGNKSTTLFTGTGLYGWPLAAPLDPATLTPPSFLVTNGSSPILSVRPEEPNPAIDELGRVDSVCGRDEEGAGRGRWERGTPHGGGGEVVRRRGSWRRRQRGLMGTMGEQKARPALLPCCLPLTVTCCGACRSLTRGRSCGQARAAAPASLCCERRRWGWGSGGATAGAPPFARHVMGFPATRTAAAQQPSNSGRLSGEVDGRPRT
eukprot:364208-Chlamydomonas_euryale.AAC.38